MNKYKIRIYFALFFIFITSLVLFSYFYMKINNFDYKFENSINNYVSTKNTNKLIDMNEIKNKNLILTSKKDIKEAINKNNYFEDFTIKKKLFNEIEITVKESKINFLLIYNNKTYKVDYFGNIYEQKKGDSLNFPVVVFETESKLDTINSVDEITPEAYLNDLFNVYKNNKFYGYSVIFEKINKVINYINENEYNTSNLNVKYNILSFMLDDVYEVNLSLDLEIDKVILSLDLVVKDLEKKNIKYGIIDVIEDYRVIYRTD